MTREEKKQYIKESYAKKFYSLLNEMDKIDQIERSNKKAKLVLIKEEGEIPADPTLDAETDEIPPIGDEYENSEEVEKEKKEEELKPKDDVTRIKEIQDLQTQKIEELDNFINNITNEISSIKSSIIDIDNIKGNIEILKTKVKEITPPTPEESLELMPKISGGISVQDYWNQYFKDNSPTKFGEDVENKEDEFLKYEITTDQIPTSFGDTFVKDSLFKDKTQV